MAIRATSGGAIPVVAIGYPVAAWAINGIVGTQIGLGAVAVTGLGAAAMSEVTVGLFNKPYGENEQLASFIGNWFLCHFAAQALSEAIGWLPMTFAEMMYIAVCLPVVVIIVILVLSMIDAGGNN
jgi:hypothetical protein